MKNIFTGIGYFVAVGAMTRVFNCREDLWTIPFLIFSLFITLLFFLSAAFFSLHVIRPIVRLSWPDFAIPRIDEGAKKVPTKKFIIRFSFWVFVILASLSFFSGLQLAGFLGNPDQC